MTFIDKHCRKHGWKYDNDPWWVVLARWTADQWGVPLICLIYFVWYFGFVLPDRF